MPAPLRAVLGAVTPTGWAVALIGLTAWAGWRVLGLAELRLVAVLSLLLLLAAVPWLLLPSRVRATLHLRPARTMAGESVEVTLRATRRGPSAPWSPLVRLPVGGAAHALRLPRVPGGVQASATLVAADLRRGVHAVGPAAAVVSDPLGLLRRPRRWADPVELFVRPRMIGVPTLGVGRQRDVEGTASDRISMSDLAFHALREYVPGDDLRHVHWRSSARAGELLVRQYHDTRRNHASVVVDADPASYDGEVAFELAASVAASLLMCAAREEYDVSLVCGPERVTGLPAIAVLDATCRLALTRDAAPLAEEVAAAQVLAPDTGVLLVVTGGRVEAEVLARTALAAPVDTRVVLLRCAPGVAAAGQSVSGAELLTVGTLADLPAMMAGGR